eukprot:1394115-Amorphochlora_amoeboformis.AAC.1
MYYFGRQRGVEGRLAKVDQLSAQVNVDHGLGMHMEREREKKRGKIGRAGEICGGVRDSNERNRER